MRRTEGESWYLQKLILLYLSLFVSLCLPFFSFLDKNFKTFIAYLIFGQIQLPGAVLNAKLLQLSETAIGIKI